MIDLNKSEGWQKRDADGMVMPWYTHPSLDEIQTWELKGKRVFEYGIGQSTIWWAKKCRWVYGVESNEEWVKSIIALNIKNIMLMFSNVEEEYVNCNLPDMKACFDIVVVDGSYRDGCIKPAIESLKPGGKLIVDNWMQPSVWMASEENQNIVMNMEHKMFKQEGHPDWKTLIATK